MNAVQRLGVGAAALAAAGALALARWPVPLAAQPAPTPRPPAEPPDMAALRAAFLSGAPDELVRAGQRLPAARLGDALGGSDRELVLAATGAAPSAPDAIWLLVPLGELAASPDRPLAAAAARSAARIAGQLDADELLDRDVPPDWTRARVAEYRARAADAGRWTDVRVSCLEVAAHLHRSLRAAGSAYDMAALLGDAEPEVRRAAVELAMGPLGPREIELVAARASSDDDDAVRAAAAQSLCEGLAFGDEARPVLDALGARGLGRLRALVADDDQPEVARAAASLCLVADGSPASRAALERSSQESDEAAPAGADDEKKDSSRDDDDDEKEKDARGDDKKGSSRDDKKDSRRDDKKDSRRDDDDKDARGKDGKDSRRDRDDAKHSRSRDDEKQSRRRRSEDR